MTGWKILPLILRHVAWRYGLAILSVGVALAVALLVGRGFEIRGALFLTAVALTAWFGGIVPGLTALLLSVLSLGYFFRPLVPYVELAGIRVPYRVLSLTFFASLALIVCWLSASRRRAEEALRESDQRWRSLTEALPQCLAQFQFMVLKGLLRPLPIGDVSARSEPFHNRPVAVPDGRSARLKPAVSPVALANTVFHVIRLSSRY